MPLRRRKKRRTHKEEDAADARPPSVLVFRRGRAPAAGRELIHVRSGPLPVFGSVGWESVLRLCPGFAV
jgi:hypothetical protein